MMVSWQINVVVYANFALFPQCLNTRFPRAYYWQSVVETCGFKGERKLTMALFSDGSPHLAVVLHKSRTNAQRGKALHRHTQRNQFRVSSTLVYYNESFMKQGSPFSDKGIRLTKRGFSVCQVTMWGLNICTGTGHNFISISSNRIITTDLPQSISINRPWSTGW